MTYKSLFAAAAVTLLLVGPLAAQDSNSNDTQQGDDHMGMGTGMMDHKGDGGPSSQAYVETRDRMHRDMDIEYTGNPDTDFANSMIAHHEGAINMAKVELQYGQDPALRKMAEQIIAAQESEIQKMKDWLTANGSKASSTNTDGNGANTNK